MDRSTLSQYGWMVIVLMVIAVMLAFSTPFGQFVAEGFKATYSAFDKSLDNALEFIGVAREDVAEGNPSTTVAPEQG